jgi:hypothetical protein
MQVLKHESGNVSENCLGFGAKSDQKALDLA